MAVLFDADMLFALYRPEAAQAVNPKTQQPITNLKARVDFLIERLDKAGTMAYIPSPALSEVLVQAGEDTNEILSNIANNSALEIVPFGTRAALELAIMTQDALKSGDKKSGSEEVWSKVKFDRQIIAIARVLGVSTIYTCDRNLKNFAEQVGIHTTHLAELAVPDEAAQIDFLQGAV